MAIYKNVASQKLAVYAYDSTDASSKINDQASITAQISKDGEATAATNDTNPTQLDPTDAPGIYLFTMTQAETDADLIILYAKSATSNILLEPLTIYTTPGNSTAIDVNAIQVEGADATDQINAACDVAVADASLATAAALTTVGGNVSDILADTGELQVDDIPGTLATMTTKINAIDDLVDTEVAAIKSVVDLILVDTGTTLDGKIDAIDDLLDTEVAAIKSVVDLILVDTNELQLDWTNGGRLDTIVDNILVDTGELQLDWTNGGRLDTIIDNILADTGELQVDNIPGTLSTMTSKIDVIDGIVDDILEDTVVIGSPAGASVSADVAAITGTALTEGYASDGAAFTLPQFCYMVWSALGEFAISGTTITAKKLDGSTTAMTFTLDDASDPTSRTRAT